MSRIEQALSQIEAVRRVANGSAPPYVARSRIGRLAMSASTLVAKHLGIAVNDIPKEIMAPEDTPQEYLELANSCNRIIHLARHIAQPSEPIEPRWKRAWKELLTELSVLEKSLIKIDQSTRNIHH